MVQVHIACPEMKTKIVTALCLATLYYHLKTNDALLSMYKFDMLFGSSPSTYRFSCFTWSAIFSHFSHLTLRISGNECLAADIKKTVCIFIKMYIKSLSYYQARKTWWSLDSFETFFALVKTNKQTNRSLSPKKKK